ncbi:MAG: hypothetical protein ACUVQ2_01560 [Dissulfurimicrobium sp.]|uniref:hypothetical protein n=1 Tax=Dissulfurimicrobium sp. TaxID=2022436 RepID=UPI00404943DB
MHGSQTFFTENHLNYEAFPYKVAFPEQFKFVVFLDNQPYYYPCTQELFARIIDKKGAEPLAIEYMKVWQRIKSLVTSVIESPYRKNFLLSLLKIKFRHKIASYVLLPSRLKKRFLQIFTMVNEIDRPLSQIKEAQSSRMAGILTLSLTSLDRLTIDIRLLQLKRLISVASYPELWTEDRPSIPGRERLISMMGHEPGTLNLAWMQITLCTCGRSCREAAL